MTSASQRVRVLHILPSFDISGAEQMAAHLMTGLSSAWDVAGVSLYAETNSSIEHRFRRAGIPIWYLNKRLGFDPKMFAALDRVLKRTQPHVVHTHMSVLRYALPSLLLRTPVTVHTVHNLAEHETDAFGRVVHWFGFRRQILPIAVSHEVAASVERVYGLKCHATIPNAIPIDTYRRSKTHRIQWRKKEHFGQDDILFTSVARLDPQKNPLLLVQAFAALNELRAHLILLGEGSLRQRLEKYIRERELESRVHLLGKRNDVPECLAASDVFVLSSNWEGNPLAVMEAMAAGLPIVGTAVGGVPELVESGRQGILVAPGDDTALTSTMRTLLDDPERRTAMGTAAQARAAAMFAVERMVRGYAAIYESALAERGARFVSQRFNGGRTLASRTRLDRNIT